MSFDFNDFGFTAVNENELEVVQNAAAAVELTSAEMESSLLELRGKLDAMHSAVIPLLNNLSANPERDYIYWPGAKRTEVIKAFKANLLQIKDK
jgi:hypothetical protein|tara:strand:- start:9151 stop:9432 length:282 start_codon:yes stop_codon:yes gene_type:complete